MDDDATTLAMVNLDCADPPAQAAFWGALLGWTTAHSEAEYAMVSPPDGAGAPIGFGRVEGYRPPAWPDPEAGKRYHLDLVVADVEAATRRAEELGATIPDEQPGEQDGTVRWRVVLDPSGHPFCLCPQR